VSTEFSISNDALRLVDRYCLLHTSRRRFYRTSQTIRFRCFVKCDDDVLRYEFRRAPIRRFPFEIFYELTVDSIAIYSVFHCSQDPQKVAQASRLLNTRPEADDDVAGSYDWYESRPVSPQGRASGPHSQRRGRLRLQQRSAMEEN